MWRSMPVFLTAMLAFPIHLISLAAGAIGFSPAAFARAATSAEAQTAALLIAFLAGVSEMLGQSVILVLNRVPLYRFLASLAFTGASYVIAALTWGLSAILIAPLTPLGPLSGAEIAGVIGIVSLAFAPRLFGALSIAPYFGLALGNLLEAWAMTLVVFGLVVGLNMPITPALICGGAGWAVSYGVRTFLGHALAKPLGVVRVFVSGSALDQTPQRIIDDVAKRLRGEKAPGNKTQ